MMSTNIVIEQGIFEHNEDYTGYKKVTQTEKRTRFFMSTVGEKTYYPQTSDEFVQGRLFEINISLSREANIIQHSIYMLTDLIIDVSGISRALYFVCLVASNFVAIYLYKVALVRDLFMVQEES